MPDLASSISKHINYLLTTATDDNSQSVLNELCQFSEFGVDGSILLLQACLDHLKKLRTDSRNMQADPLIMSLFKYLLDRPNFPSAFCQLLTTSEANEGFLEYLSSALNLYVPEKIALGLALSDSENHEIKICGNKFCTAQVEVLLAKGLSDYSSEQIEKILALLQRSESLCKHLDAFSKMMSLAQFEDVSSFILAPLLSDKWLEANYMRNQEMISESNDGLDDIIAEIDEDMKDGNIMMELGYGYAVTVPQCKEILSTLFSTLSESIVARIFGAVACSREVSEDNLITFPTFSLVLGCNNSSDLPVPSSWNVYVLVDTIKQLAPNMNWTKVVESLDYDGFYFPDESAFSIFMNAYRIACQEPFPLHAICGSVWNNTEGQLSFLKYAVSAAPETFSFVHASRQLAYVDAVHGHKLNLGHANYAWLCLDLLNVLCELAERGHADAVRSILEYPLKHCPEMLLLGLSHINTACNVLQLEISRAVFPMVLKNVLGSGIVHYLWHVNPYFLLRGFADAHNADPDILVRILDICQELKIISSVIEIIPFSSGIRLAALASSKELFDLERWLISNLNTYKDNFFEECLKFLKEIQSGGSQDPFLQSRSVLNTYLETSPIFSKVLKAHIGLLTSNQLAEEMETLQLSNMEPNPRLQNGGATESASDGFADDVEAEANSYFHQMFSGQLDIGTMVDMLARFKESPVKREQLIFECMIANVFEEYRFYPKYPERQLTIAALLFGSVIKTQLVTHLTLGIALRRVLDALRKPPDSKMFVFGTKALEQFVDRLIEWPQYCNHILQISHLRGTQPEIVAFIEGALARISSGHMESDGGNSIPSIQHHSSTQAASGVLELNGISGTQHGQQHSSIHLQQRIESSLDDRQRFSEALLTDSKLLLPSSGQSSSSPVDAFSTQKNAASAPAAAHSSSPGFIRPSRAATSTRFGSALNIETLVAAAERREAPIEAPASEIQDKISFIINNISTANIDTKAKEFTENLREQYYPWFSQYMVMKRASIEPNFHDLYLKFLDKVNSKALYREIVQASYENCKVLLGSELIKSSSEERSLLKNLGSWLGKLTIGRNQVLRASHIDPKSLIIEAYEKGLMIAVIPFTSKILEPCHSSLAYQPPNPWTMGILSLLAEIYSMPALKMNLKFDIEVLFKNLAVDLKDITPSCLLKDRKREVEGNPDFSNKDVGAPQPQVVPEVKPAIMPSLSQVELPIDVGSPSNTAGPTHLLSQYASPLHLSSGALMEDEKLAALGLSDQLPSARGLFQASPSQSHFSVNQVPAQVAIGTHVVINPKLSALGLQMHFQRVVPIAMDRAIKEIVSNIVQRSVSIATQTTKELVLKDYASETDDSRTRNAARLMVASLAGSLAHVTCKEPLRSSISSQLRNSLQGLNVTSELLEQAVQLVTNDNLDLGCAFIEQAATEKAMHTIDGEMSQQLAIRRKHREAIGPTFFDANMFGQGSMAIVPELLRPKPGHLSHSQQRVYEDFVRLPWQSQTVLSGDMSSGTASVSGSYGSAGQQNTGSSLGLGNTAFDPSTRSIDVPEPVEATSAPLHSSSPGQMGASEVTIQHGFEKETVAVSLHPSEPVESSNTIKDLGQTQPLPSAVVSISEPSLTTGDALEKYLKVAQKLEGLIAGDSKEADIQGIVAEVPDIILRCISRDEAALAVAQKVFKGLYENSSNNFHARAHLAILAAIRDVCKLVVKELTSWVLYSEEERKFNKDITVGLIRSELLNLAEYNMHMAKLIDGGRNKSATEFAVSLLQTLVAEEPKVISELHNLVDALAKVAAKPGSPESLQQLVEIARNPSGSTAALTGTAVAKEDKSRQPRDKKVPGQPVPSREDYNASEPTEPDPAGFREQVSMYFADWYRLCEHPGANDAACTHYILQLHQKGLLKGDDLTDRFIRILTELSVSHCLSSEVISSGSLQLPQQSQTLSFLAIDIYAKLVYSILKGSNKLSLLTKILAVTIRLIQKDAEEKKASFNPRPYFRLFINWLLDLTSLEPVTDGANFEILTAFANAFHALQPLKLPGFSFTWLELVSHRSFMPKLLTANAQKGWVYMQRLLVDLFQFMEPFLRNAELGAPVRLLYKGTLRVLLVLLHDFPEFLSDHHFTFCDVIPASCIQMRNIILSAFPSNMRLPDPSTPNLKIDLLPEISLQPRIMSEVDAALKAKQMKADVDEYLKTGQNSTFLTELKQKLLLGPSEVACAGTRYNVPLINSLVLYVGMQAIQQLQSKTPHAQSTVNTVPLAVFLVGAALDIFRTLMLELDTEGRYLFLNAIANQLRYPNNHTHYFSFILLYLFAESNQEIIQEQITRVLLERLIVNRPHPWGLLITFIELIKNPQYSFWSRSFIRCAPEIEKLFESVSRSCGGPKLVDESMVSGWVSENTH